MRATSHLFVLALVGALTLGGLGTSWSPGVTSTASAAPGAPAATRTPPSSLVGAQSVGAFGGDQAGATPVATPPPLKPPPRQWVQNHRPTELFTGPEPNAASLGSAPQFSTFQLLEVRDEGRSKLFDPGRGFGRLPTTVWANLADFGPSGPPQPEFELATGGGNNPLTGRPIPERVGDGWPRVPSAEVAVVLDGDSGAVLYGKSAHARVAPASLTKIMTAIVAIERGNPKDRVRVNVDSRTMWESTVMGLTPDEVVSLETLLYGLMLPSGNDAALAIGRHIGGSDARFVEMMNEKARSLGLENTQFKNPHGLDEDGHYSSPYDLAMMSRYGMQDPLFYNLSATRNWQAEGYNLWNLNKLLGQYPGADGVKVGFTDAAGRCIVASATRNGHRVFVALQRSNDPVGDSRMLLDYAFQNFRWP